MLKKEGLFLVILGRRTKLDKVISLEKWNEVISVLNGKKMIWLSFLAKFLKFWQKKSDLFNLSKKKLNSIKSWVSADNFEVTISLGRESKSIFQLFLSRKTDFQESFWVIVKRMKSFFMFFFRSTWLDKNLSLDK